MSMTTQLVNPDHQLLLDNVLEIHRPKTLRVVVDDLHSVRVTVEGVTIFKAMHSQSPMDCRISTGMIVSVAEPQSKVARGDSQHQLMKEISSLQKVISDVVRNAQVFVDGFGPGDDPPRREVLEAAVTELAKQIDLCRSTQNQLKDQLNVADAAINYWMNQCIVAQKAKDTLEDKLETVENSHSKLQADQAEAVENYPGIKAVVDSMLHSLGCRQPTCNPDRLYLLGAVSKNYKGLQKQYQALEKTKCLIEAERSTLDFQLREAITERHEWNRRAGDLAVELSNVKPRWEAVCRLWTAGRVELENRGQLTHLPRNSQYYLRAQGYLGWWDATPEGVIDSVILQEQGSPRNGCSEEPSANRKE